MSPTEYRAIAKRCTLRPLAGLRHACAAGEPLNPEVVRAWQERRRRVGARRLRPDRDRPPDRDADRPAGAARLDGQAAARLSGLDRRGRAGAWTRRPCPPSSSTAPRDGPWHTGDRVREDEDGYLWFEGRTDDVIISAGYRIGPFEVESALVSHPAVAEAAAVAAPDEVRGQVVRAVVVLRDGYEPGDALARELQEHVKAETAPVQVPAHRRLRATRCRRRRAGRSSAPSCAISRGDDQSGPNAGASSGTCSRTIGFNAGIQQAYALAFTQGVRALSERQAVIDGFRTRSTASPLRSSDRDMRSSARRRSRTAPASFTWLAVAMFVLLRRRS